ncbi:glycine--tRNA ligase subunit beta [Candidatus Omnitrophota bacterium]
MEEDRKDFLLEINTEELPAGYISPALEALRVNSAKDLISISGEDIKPDMFGTKDSLIWRWKDIPNTQKESLKETLGPPKRIAFDDKGNPTKQALGFAKNQGVKVEELKVKITPKGEYIFIEKKEASRSTKDILKETIPRIIKEIHFPKTMRWDDSGLRFARPIESVLALFGRENLDVKLGNVLMKKVKSLNPAQYLKSLKLVDVDKRREEIRRLILKEIKHLSGDQVIDKRLLEEVNFMVNSPVVFSGEFSKKFLALPQDVLKASMAKHQRIFPVSKNGKLVNRFIAVLEGKKRKNKKVIKNYENVLEAKLKDSLFFFNEDTKKPLSENIPQLKDLIFQRDLGNMFGKIERLKKLSFFICEKICADSSLKKDTERAAFLSKADLVTHMVGEFPSLQGIIGGEYALKDGENEKVAIAIKEQYLPQGAEDDLPKTNSGAILAVSDKLDNLVGFSGMNIENISGSFDPFGIRRNALGLIRIIKDASLKIDLEELIVKAIGLYGEKLKGDTVKFKNKIIDFVKDRIDFLMGDVRPIELKHAILKSGAFDVADIFKRKEVLMEIKKEKYFLEAAKVVERTSNILKGAKNEKIGEVDKSLFKEDLERRVWKAYLDSKGSIKGHIEREEYKEATKEYANTFFKVLHEFFDKVLVNDEDKSLRLNRLAMMKAINRLYVERVADLALLPQIVT